MRRHVSRALAPWAIALTAACLEPQVADDDPARTLEIVWTHPEAGGNFAATGDTIDICFSHPLAPGSVASRSASLHSGDVAFSIETQLQLFPWRRLLAEPSADPSGGDPQLLNCPGSVISIVPRSPLVAGARHRLLLDDQLRGWSGERPSVTGPGWTLEAIEPDADDDEDAPPEYDALFTLAFEVVPALAPADDRPRGPRRLADLFAPGQVFAPDQNNCGCHRDPQHLAFSRLNLSTPVTAAAGLDSGLAGSGWPMISPGRPEASYLVHKLIRDPKGHALRTVVGDAMPPDSELDPLQRASIAGWIQDGAHR